jgi:hypothetical protein
MFQHTEFLLSMARRSSSSSGARTRSTSRSAPSSSPAPRTSSLAPSQNISSGGMLSGLKDTLAHSIVSGVGWSMASRAMDAVIGPRQVEMVHRNEPSGPQSFSEPPRVDAPQRISQSNVCQVQQDQVNQCLSHASDMIYCQTYLDSLKQCQQMQSTSLA